MVSCREKSVLLFFLSVLLVSLLGCPGDGPETKAPEENSIFQDQRPAEELSPYFSALSPKAALKPFNQHNPISTHDFGADPWVMVYEDRAYMYLTGDALQYNAAGALIAETYGNINFLHVLSSGDMVNWQDHGDIKIGGADGLAPWANNGNGNAWAPCAAYKIINGKARFFLYWADNSRGIGVLTANSPTGPWAEPLGTLLIDRNTPNCTEAQVPWLFDPAVLVDDDGSAYLYFGGGADGMYPAPRRTSALYKSGLIPLTAMRRGMPISS
ncbi:hypothetical protein AGMMS50267_08700 [Spirochaetia bacterium]|nr:hypothetical protein AGMMS50267_08700 [Spirochaetia bacterium]